MKGPSLCWKMTQLWAHGQDIQPAGENVGQKKKKKGNALVGNVGRSIINIQIVPEALTIDGISLPRENGEKGKGC